MLEIIALTLVIVVAFVAASWYAHQRSQQRAKAFERELDISERFDDDEFEQRFDALLDSELQQREVAHEAPEHDATPDLFAGENAATSGDEAESAMPENDISDSPTAWDMVIALTIMAPPSSVFTGRAVKAALDGHDMHFGDMQIYHRFTPGPRRQVLFSAANILDPGTLLPDKFVSMSTPGLLLFARLPGPVNGMALFDDLLDTARGMSDRLGGILCDDQRQPLDDETLEAMRARILDFQMTLQAEQTQHPNDYFN